ncbi:hypothetical protein ACH47C_40775 [Streptomyces rishiriensis]|uniref:hypothetical protein n=1 Tax=Streptomyces rishiriensis TaxID=68264 RepID=UPI0033E5514D
MQQFGVGDVVGAVLGGDRGALRGEYFHGVAGGGGVLPPGAGRTAGAQGAGRDREGVEELLGFLPASRVRGGGVGANGPAGLGQVLGELRVQSGGGALQEGAGGLLVAQVVGDVRLEDSTQPPPVGALTMASRLCPSSS